MSTAFLIVDMQNDFMPKGALPVPQADQIIPVLNQLLDVFPIALASLDWHPLEHISFVTNHANKMQGEVVVVDGIEQILWPVHCVRGTVGAELVSSLKKEKISTYFYKGTDAMIDSYSAFFDNARRRSTGLGEYLTSRKIKELVIAGVATDYCVLYSALDALDLGLRVIVVEDACRGINLHAHDVERAFTAMSAKGARIHRSKEFLNS